MVRQAMEEFPTDFRKFFSRQSVVPFESALAASAIFSGVAALFNGTITALLFNDLIPPYLALAFNLIYIIGGFAIFAGVGWGYRNLEAFGLILLLTSLVIRAVALLIFVGISPITSSAIMQAVTFGAACISKLVTLVKRRTVVILKPESEGASIVKQ